MRPKHTRSWLFLLVVIIAGGTYLWHARTTLLPTAGGPPVPNDTRSPVPNEQIQNKLVQTPEIARALPNDRQDFLIDLADRLAEHAEIQAYVLCSPGLAKSLGQKLAVVSNSAQVKIYPRGIPMDALEFELTAPGLAEFDQQLRKYGNQDGYQDNVLYVRTADLVVDGRERIIALAEQIKKIRNGNRGGVNEIRDAISNGDLRKVEILIKSNPDLVFSKDEEGDTPLHVAASFDQSDAVRLLLANKAEVNAKDIRGIAALHLAAFGGDKMLVGSLLSNGADVNAVDNAGRSPLHAAASSGHRDVAELLLGVKAEVNFKDNDGETPLHLAAFHGHKSVAELLLASGADVSAKNKNGDTPLHEGALHGHKEVVEVLLVRNAAVNARDNYGLTALHIAAAAGYREVVKSLLASNADVTVRDKDGKTPQDWARDKGYVDLAELLPINNVATLGTNIVPSDYSALVAMVVSQLKEKKHDKSDKSSELVQHGSLDTEHKAEGPAQVLTILGLANIDCECGQHWQAESSYNQAIRMLEKIEPNGPTMAGALNKLANLYVRHGRFGEAEVLYQHALAIRKRLSGPDHPEVAVLLGDLGGVHFGQRQLLEAETLYKKALTTWAKVRDPDPEAVGSLLNNLACLCAVQRRYAEALPLFNLSLTIKETALFSEHPAVAVALIGLANLYGEQGQLAEAERRINRAISILDSASSIAYLAGESAVPRERSYWTRARIRWARKQPDLAISDLRRAMELAEDVRATAGGDERGKAVTFAEEDFVFEQMVAWQDELRNPTQAFDALERSRARSLLDQMETNGMDPLKGQPEEFARQLRADEASARIRLSKLKKQLQLLDGRKDVSTEQKKQQSEQLAAELRQAELDFANSYAAIRNASPAYRLAVEKDFKPVSLKKLQSWVAGQQALLLEYLAGSENGYVLIVPADSEPHLARLALDSQQAKALGVDAGPLTSHRLSQVFSNEQGTGVVDRLRKAESTDHAQKISGALAVLWKALIPQAEREAILAGKYKRLIVLPDGALARLPFEAMVVDEGDKPQYLLGVGPPIEYAPSATILMNLAERPDEGSLNGREPVLTVGACRYVQPSDAAEDDVLAKLTPQSRYVGLGGRLDSLPHSAAEMSWVSKTFSEKGTQVACLNGDLATKAAVRLNAPGRRVLHFACHGLLDERYGNLFGALALTPGAKREDPADDGFLTLSEVYEMNLKGCELTILSACDSNNGPEQRGEGVWALSRGFLVAGSRRVVASNWLVNDQAAASLVSVFCSYLAEAEKERQKPDYAQALQKAKLWVRNNKDHEDWHSPYYWGTFVLLGPG